MSSFEPLINLVLLLTVLSVAAERATNVLKLGNKNLRLPQITDAEAEKTRERGITKRTIWAGVILAILVKADLFEILAHLDAPWATLGWVRVVGADWVRTPGTTSIGAALYALGGSALTGVALGFGSKFWHEVLDAVFEIRGIVKNVRQKQIAPQATGTSSDAGGAAGGGKDA